MTSYFCHVLVVVDAGFFLQRVVLLESGRVDTVLNRVRDPIGRGESDQLSVCPRGHTVAQAGDWWQVYCFADPEHAEKFRLKFNGKTFDPALKGRGRNWASYRGEL